jgi:hypothetical protein
MVQDAVWARIVSAYENGEPVDANAVKFIVNSFERDIRSQLDSQRQAQIQTRQAAPKPIAPTGGASAVPTDNVEQFTVPKTADGEVDWGSLNRQALRTARLPSNRR